MAKGLPSLPNDALASSHFALEFDGIEQFQFQEVSGLTVERDVITLKENGPDGHPVLKLMPGNLKQPTITLKRGTNMSKAMFDWFEQAQEGIGDARADGLDHRVRLRVRARSRAGTSSTAGRRRSRSAASRRARRSRPWRR